MIVVMRFFSVTASGDDAKAKIHHRRHIVYIASSAFVGFRNSCELKEPGLRAP